MNKKQYTTPVVRKVKLESKNTILGFCHSSPNIFPKTQPFTCSEMQGGACPNPP